MMKRLSVWIGGILLLLSFLLSGCGELEFGVETRLSSGKPDPVTVVVTATQEIADNMVLVTVTPSPSAERETPSVTPTVDETTTATPSATPTETATPSPTARATTRPFVPTATPVPPHIFSFTAGPDTVQPGSTVALNWSAEGESAQICLRFASGYTYNCYDEAVSGSTILPIEAEFREDIIFDLTVSNTAGQEALASVYLAVECPDDYWFFDNPPSGCPSMDPVETNAAAQYFENGWMLWEEETDTIYAFHDPQRTFAVFYSGFADPNDPAANNSDYDPPDGLYVPKRGFGLVWHYYSYWREILGWALQPEFGYNTTYQVDTDSYSSRQYVLDPDGRIVVLNLYSQTWSYR
ncbi:MAG: hypothetical protein WAM60_05950 [Candidatus Promineifilaceae bacterium]